MNAGVVVILTVTFSCCTAQDVLSPPYIDILGNILELLGQIELWINKFVDDILSLSISPILRDIIKPPLDQLGKLIVGPIRNKVNSLLNGTTELTVEDMNKLRDLVINATAPIDAIIVIVANIPDLPPLVKDFYNILKALLEQVIAYIDEILQALAAGQKRHHAVYRKSVIRSIHN